MVWELIVKRFVERTFLFNKSWHNDEKQNDEDQEDWEDIRKCLAQSLKLTLLFINKSRESYLKKVDQCKGRILERVFDEEPDYKVEKEYVSEIALEPAIFFSKHCQEKLSESHK